MAASLNSAAADLRECAVCLDDMLEKKPKFLECKHSYCMSRLSGLAEVHEISGLKVACPECRHKTYLKSGNLSDLPDNFLLQKVKAVIDDHTRYLYCFYCKEKDRERRAVSLCISCLKYMCNDCLDKHRRALKKHEIKHIVSKKHKDREYCKKHNELVVYACLACSPVNLLCDVCIMNDNPCHPFSDLVEYTSALSQEKTNLKSNLKQQHMVELSLSEVEVICNKELSVIKETVSVFQDTIETTAAEITSLTERAYNIKSLKLKSDKVKQLGQIAEGLLNSEISTLEEFRKTSLELNKALDSFSGEEKNINRLDLKPDSAAKFRAYLSEIFIEQLLLNKNLMRDEEKLVSDASIVDTSSRNLDGSSLTVVSKWNQNSRYEINEINPGASKEKKADRRQVLGTVTKRCSRNIEERRRQNATNNE